MNLSKIHSLTSQEIDTIILLKKCHQRSRRNNFGTRNDFQMKIEESSRIMYVNKEALGHNETAIQAKNSTTIVHPIAYEPSENIDATTCCKFDRNISNVRVKNFESEKGETISFIGV